MAAAAEVTSVPDLRQHVAEWRPRGQTESTRQGKAGQAQSSRPLDPGRDADVTRRSGKAPEREARVAGCAATAWKGVAWSPEEHVGLPFYTTAFASFTESQNALGEGAGVPLVL